MGRDGERRGPGEAAEEARDEGRAGAQVGVRSTCWLPRRSEGGRALIFVIVVTATDINNVGIITIDIGINFNKGASTCISHAGADVTSPPRRFRKNLYHEIREARRARASTEDLCPPQSRAAIGPFDH